MDIRILGPVVATGPVGPVRLAGRIRPAVAGALALWPGRAMPRSQLAEAIWGASPPPTAMRVLARHLTALNKFLDLDLTGPCCALCVEPEAVDAHRFVALFGRAMRTRDPDAACLQRGLSLWRGEPIPLHGWAAAETARLREMRMLAEQALWQARLGHGVTDGAVPALERLVATHPLQERLWELLMVALYQTGRRSDALIAFGRLSAILKAQLEIEPSPRLCRLRDRVVSAAGR